MEQSVLLEKYFIQLNHLGYTRSSFIPEGLKIQMFWFFDTRETDKAHKSAANILDFVLLFILPKYKTRLLHQGTTPNVPFAF